MNKKKLHLGCGKRDFGPDWIHIDGADYPHIKFNNIQQLPFDDNSVEVIYASHVIEYFDREEVMSLLKEWKRVLKPEGILRLAVPDFEAMSMLYTNKKITLYDILGPLYGKMDLGNQKIYHKTVYDFRSLVIILATVGFKATKKYDWSKTEHSHIDDHSQAYLNPKGDKEKGILISLNVECIK